MATGKRARYDHEADVHPGVTRRGIAQRMVRSWLWAVCVALLTGCGSGGAEYTPRGDVWSGFTLPPGLVQYFVEGILIHEIYFNGSPTDTHGLVLYFNDPTSSDDFGIYKAWNKAGQEGGGVIFLDEAKSAGFLFGSIPFMGDVGFLAIIQKTHENIPLGFLYDDILRSWIGVTKETDGVTATSSPTTLTCGLASSCAYTRYAAGGIVGGTVSALAYDSTTYFWSGYFSEPGTGRSGQSILAMTPDKTVVFMINCDTDHKSPIKYTDCSYFIGIPS
jgi:hypothetical protein